MSLIKEYLELTKNYDIEIYIHTWHIKQNDLSWRKINIDNTNINL
jgi:hypothetical protein